MSDRKRKAPISDIHESYEAINGDSRKLLIFVDA